MKGLLVRVESDTVPRVERGVSPSILLELDDDERVLDFSLRPFLDFSHRKTVDWHYTATIVKEVGADA